MKSLKTTASAVALALSVAAPLAHAHGGGADWGGYGGCPGMMGGHGMGPGMMGGYGMGPGMMGGYGAGGGMMGMGPYNALNLNDQQRTQVLQIKDQVRKQQWDLMGKMRDESVKLRNMMAAEKPNPAAVGQQQMKIADLQRQMLESRVDAHNRINYLLTPEQRAQMRNYGPGWMMDGGSHMDMPGNQTP